MVASVLFKAMAWLMAVVQQLTKKVERSRVVCRTELVDKVQPVPADVVKEPIATSFPISLSGRRITGISQLKLLELLVNKAWVTRSEIDNYLGVQNSPDVIMRMGRSGGWRVLKFDFWSPAGVGTRKRRRFYYMLPNNECDVAQAMLKMAVGSSASLTPAA